MTQEPGQIPLLMRSEDLANWDNWLSRPETAALEQLLRVQVPEHSAYVWGAGGMGKSHILQACCDAEGLNARYIPLRDLVDFAPEQVLADTEMKEFIMTAFGMPESSANASVDSLKKMLEKRMDIEDLQDPEVQEKLIRQFSAFAAVTQSQTTENAAVTLLSQGNSYNMVTIDIDSIQGFSGYGTR